MGRFISAWIGSTEGNNQNMRLFDNSNSPSLLDHFISGLREFIEILMAYSIDIPYIGHHILTAYLFILNSTERILSSFRSDEESENSDEYENSSICSEETLVLEENGGTLDFSESEDDIEIKVVFLD